MMLRLIANVVLRAFRSTPKRGGVVYVTQQEIDAEMNAVAQGLGLTLGEALQRLDRGELEGTTAELRLRMLRYLRRPQDEVPPRAAA